MLAPYASCAVSFMYRPSLRDNCPSDTHKWIRYSVCSAGSAPLRTVIKWFEEAGRSRNSTFSCCSERLPMRDNTTRRHVKPPSIENQYVSNFTISRVIFFFKYGYLTGLIPCPPQFDRYLIVSLVDADLLRYRILLSFRC